MLAAFILSIVENSKLGVRLITALVRARAVTLPVRLPVAVLVWLGCVLLAIMHWLGFLLDELLFRGYRNVDVKQPIFIIGIPRSGTTWLQRVMAEDQQLTSLTLWECLFAPSITERYIWRGLAYVLRPAFSLLASPMRRWFKGMDAVHKIRLDHAEEDFLLLLPLQACFLMVLLCPNTSHYWRLGKFDREFSVYQRKVIMRYYHACLQKHLYYHGEDKRLLSKNPSFTPFIHSLSRYFQGAHFVACIRAPEQTVASQLSSLMPALKLLGEQQMDVRFRDDMIKLLLEYYKYLLKNRQEHNILLVDIEDITLHLGETIQTIYYHAELGLSDQFQQRVQMLETSSKNYKSGHRYQLEAFNLTQHTVAETFSKVWPVMD